MPKGWLMGYRTVTLTVTRTDYRTVNLMGFQKANQMVINLECLRLDSLKAIQMVIHWDWHLG